MTAGHDERDSSGGDADERSPVAAAAPYAAALAGLPGAGPATLVALLREWTPEEAWRRIKEGRLIRPQSRRNPGRDQLGFDLSGSDRGGGPEQCPGPAARWATVDDSWRDSARRLDPPGWWARHAAHGIGVTWIGQPDYPEALVDDPEPPGVLFWRGSLLHLSGPCVAIVGTRRATPDGRSVAFELGRDLAESGICVVSGLALGIDGAAHAGAVSVVRRAVSGFVSGPNQVGAGVADRPGQAARAGGVAEAASGGSVLVGAAAAGPAGVAASGVDVPYPRRHARLWDQVIDAGVMLSETLPGRAAQAWRFPARNRIIAGLASMVVVVESHAGGGSLITADAAINRGIEVRVVPGPVHSPASEGSNQLLYDGAGPVRSARDVLDGLGIFISKPVQPSADAGAPAPVAGAPPVPAGSRAPRVPPVPATSRALGVSPVPSVERAAGARPLDSEARHVLEAVSWRPTSLNQVLAHAGLPIAAVSRTLDSLEAFGLVKRDGQWWVRRPGSRPP